MNNTIKSLLGLGMKAGNVVSGEDTCKSELKKNRLYLIIVAEDASNNTKKVFQDKSKFRNVPIRLMSTKEELGVCIGKVSRAVIGVKDEKFAKKILQCIDENC